MKSTVVVGLVQSVLSITDKLEYGFTGANTQVQSVIAVESLVTANHNLTSLLIAEPVNLNSLKFLVFIFHL